MGFEIPKRQLKSIQTQKRNVPIDQIIAVQGQNPFAQGIETAGNVLGQAMSQRLEMQRQGQQLAKLEQLSGQQPGAYTDLDPQTAATFTGSLIKQRENNYTPSQLLAIESGDATQLAKVFPNGTPREALTTFETVANRKNQRAAVGSDKEQSLELRRDKAILDYSEALERNPVVKTMRTQNVSLGQMDNLVNLAKSGNTVASSAIGTKMARAMGEVGVLTESDIKRYVQSGQLARGVGDKLSRWIEGRPTEATLEEIGQIANVLKDSFKEKVQPVYGTYTNRLSRNFGMTPEEAAFKLDVPYENKPLKKMKTRGPASFPQETLEQRKARLIQEAQGL